MYLREVTNNKQNKPGRNFFWHLECHRRTEQDPDSSSKHRRSETLEGSKCEGRQRSSLNWRSYTISSSSAYLYLNVIFSLCYEIINSGYSGEPAAGAGSCTTDGSAAEDPQPGRSRHLCPALAHTQLHR
jgi:hypothetical protein